jgi:hypothetical protein
MQAAPRLESRQTIVRSPVDLAEVSSVIIGEPREPEFQENHRRLKAERLAREAGMKAKGR